MIAHGLSLLGPTQVHRMYMDLTGKQVRFTVNENRLAVMRKRILSILGDLECK